MSNFFNNIFHILYDKIKDNIQCIYENIIMNDVQSNHIMHIWKYWKYSNWWLVTVKWCIWSWSLCFAFNFGRWIDYDIWSVFKIKLIVIYDIAFVFRHLFIFLVNAWWWGFFFFFLLVRVIKLICRLQN